MDVNRMGKRGLAPLHVASRKGNIKVVRAELLKSENLAVNVANRLGETALVLATKDSEKWDVV